MRKPPAVQGPGGMVKAGAVQKHDGRQRAIEVPATGRDKGFNAIDGQLHGSSLLRRPERLAEVVDNVLGGFDADREPKQLFANSGGFELGGIHLLMGGAGGMNDQRLGVADIGEVADQPQALDEFLAGRPAALDSEAYDRPRAARQQSPGQRMIRMGFQRRMQNPVYRLVRGQEFQNRVGIRDMAVHADAEGLYTLQQLKGIGRREAGAEVAQALGARPHDERRWAELLVENDAVITGIWLGQHRKFSGKAPI